MEEKPFVSTCEFPVELFQHTLERLDLSENNLQIFPETICELTSLQELDLSRYLFINASINFSHFLFLF